MKPIPIKKYKAYLKSLGLYHKRTSASHEIWDKTDNSLLRPITVDNNYSEVPILHIKTSLKSLGIKNSDFERDIKNF
ncbi:MAG: hypothetical protein ACOYN6_08580 [Ignavibacteria bacterium]